MKHTTPFPDNALDYAFDKALGCGYFDPELVSEREKADELCLRRQTEIDRVESLNSPNRQHDLVVDRERTLLYCCTCKIKWDALTLKGSNEQHPTTLLDCVIPIELEVTP